MSPSHFSHFVGPDHDHQQCIAGALATAERLCQEQKQRFTTMRRRVFELIWQQHKPIGAYAILESLQQDGRVAAPTVYRALDFLLNLGLVHRIASLNAFVGCARPGVRHDGYFLICATCWNCAELRNETITGEIDRSAGNCGFVVQSRSVEISGLCPECADQQASVAAP